MLEQVWEKRTAAEYRAEDCDVDWRDIVNRQEGDLFLTWKLTIDNVALYSIAKPLEKAVEDTTR